MPTRTDLAPPRTPLPGSKSESDVDVMYKVVVELGLLQWVKSFAGRTGFMFDKSPELQLISDHPSMEGHSGASFACCLRAVQSRVMLMH